MNNETFLELLRNKSTEGDNDNSKRKRNHRDSDNSSVGDFSDTTAIKITPEFNSIMRVQEGRKYCANGARRNSTLQNIDIRHSPCDTPASIASVLDRQLESPGLTELIFRKLEQIIATQDHHSIILDNISRNQASLNPERPENLPNLPVSNKQEYKALEAFLIEELPFEYMKKRLAALGGATVRGTVMGMLKFLLSNEVAMKFNWAGRDKKPFKGTNTMRVVMEAVRYSYIGREEQDLTDKVIEDSVKDWLKLAKARHDYSLRKQE